MIFNEKIISILDDMTGLHSVPFNTADDMINMLDRTDFFKEPDLTTTASDYINSHRVIDISCKSGSLLFSFYKKFMIALRNVFPDRDDRDYFIVRNLLFGLCPSDKYLNMLRAIFYDNKKYDLSNELGNFYHYDFKERSGVDSKEAKELLENMKFDVVCGNPPYNDDMYLDFVLLGHRLAKSYDLWITPVTFVTPSIGKSTLVKNNKTIFSSDLVKHINSLCYYLDEVDIFMIKKPGGVAYYLLDKDEHTSINIKNICNRVNNGVLNSIAIRPLVDKCMFLNLGADIDSKLNYKSLKLSELPKFKRFALMSSDMVAYCNSVNKKYGFFSTDGNVCVIPEQGIFDTTVDKHSSSVAKILFSSDNYNDVLSFQSYIDSKFIRFKIMCGLGSSACYNDDVFRFVPDPGSFDKVYEDKPLEGYTPDEDGVYTDSKGVVHCSLYVKYKLTDEEISVIESVIRERK